MTCREQWPEEPQRWCGGCLHLGSWHHAEGMPIPTPEPPVKRWRPLHHLPAMAVDDAGAWVKWSEVEALLLQRAQEIAELTEENTILHNTCGRHEEHLMRRAQEIEQVKAALARVAELLPDPIWNARGVLIWSLLDVERVRAAISRADQP